MNKTIIALSAFVLVACVPKPDVETHCKENAKQVLIIGDSISIGYTPYVRANLGEDFCVSHNPGNANNSSFGLNRMDTWLGADQYEVITFNFGIHDLCPIDFCHETNLPDSGNVQVELVDYESNLRAIITKLKTHTNRVVFFTTTNVEYIASWEALRPDYNAVAVTVMAQEGVELVDLGSFSDTVTALHLPHDIHWTPEGYRQLGQVVTEAINE